MSNEPKFASRGPSIEPMSSANGNGCKPHSVLPADIPPGEKRKPNLKPAFFFLAVALLLILANWLGHTSETPDSNATRPPLQNISLVLHPRPRAESQSSLLVQFRLINMGNQSVFYPVHPSANVPVGQIVARTSAASNWLSLPDPSKQGAPPVQQVIDQNVAWIEMPPGGWVDGEVHDPGEFPGEHAYAINLKPERNADVIRIVSEPYRSHGITE